MHGQQSGTDARDEGDDEQERLARAISQAGDLASSAGRLLFLTVFGSALYGTTVAGHSDLDIRGVFLPDQRDGAAGMRGLHWSSATDRRRNDETDTDIDLMSLDRWLLHALPAGDTGALDVLFAPTNTSCTLFSAAGMEQIFASPLSFLNLADGSCCRRYVLNQGKSYGLAGTRLGALWRMSRFLETVSPDARLAEYADALVSVSMGPEYCSVTESGALDVGGKIQEPCVMIGEVLQRLKKMLAGHEQRIRDARKGAGVDWKALSHGLRAIRQQKELLQTGRLVFPLRDREEILRIKQGACLFEDVENMLTQELAELETLRKQSPYAATSWDRGFAESVIAAFRRA